MRKFDNIENCEKFLDELVLPVIRNLDWGETVTLCIGCGEKDLCIIVDNYNKETNEISFECIITDLTGDVCVEDTLNCGSMKLFLSKTESFLQGDCPEKLYEGHDIQVNFIVMETNLCADVNEKYEDCGYVEENEDNNEDDISILLEDGKDETEKMIENVLENTIQNYIDEYGYIEAKSEWDGKIVRVKIELYGYETKVSDYNHTVYDAPILKIKASEQNSADGVIVHSLKTIQECVALLMSVPTDWYDFYIHEDNVLEKIYWMTGDSYYEDESGKLQPLLLEPLYDSDDDDDLPF